MYIYTPISMPIPQIGLRRAVGLPAADVYIYIHTHTHIYIYIHPSISPFRK